MASQEFMKEVVSEIKIVQCLNVHQPLSAGRLDPMHDKSGSSLQICSLKILHAGIPSVPSGVDHFPDLTVEIWCG